MSRTTPCDCFTACCSSFMPRAGSCSNTDNRRYREMSLRKLKEEISEKLDQGDSPRQSGCHPEGLRDLFRLINDGSEAFGYSREEFYIPAYNGGLFDRDKNPFLSSKRIGNSYLAAAIDLWPARKESGERLLSITPLWTSATWDRFTREFLSIGCTWRRRAWRQSRRRERRSGWPKKPGGVQEGHRQG